MKTFLRRFCPTCQEWLHEKKEVSLQLYNWYKQNCQKNGDDFGELKQENGDYVLVYSISNLTFSNHHCQ